jgi:hypothetical protein
MRRRFDDPLQFAAVFGEDRAGDFCSADIKANPERQNPNSASSYVVSERLTALSNQSSMVLRLIPATIRS